MWREGGRDPEPLSRVFPGRRAPFFSLIQVGKEEPLAWVGNGPMTPPDRAAHQLKGGIKGGKLEGLNAS